MNERLKDLISPRLWAVYIPSDCRYLPDESPYNNYTADNVVSYYNTLDELETVCNDLQGRLGETMSEISIYPMSDVVAQLADADFYIGDGVLLWVEVGNQ